MSTSRQAAFLAVLCVLLAGCTGARYRLPDALEGEALVPYPAKDAAVGEWRPKGVFRVVGTHGDYKSTFKLQRADGRRAQGECRRSLTDPEQSKWFAHPTDFTIACVVALEDGTEIGRLSVWWVDKLDQAAEAVAYGEALKLHSGGDSFWRLPGGVPGYDIAHGGEPIGVLAYVGKPGLYLREETAPGLKSASHLTALMLTAAYRTDRSAQDDVHQVELTSSR